MATKASEGNALEVQKEFPLSLQEFCTRLSQDDKRVELIGAFHADQQASGHMKDTETNYRERFAQFGERPVIN